MTAHYSPKKLTASGLGLVDLGQLHEQRLPIFRASVRSGVSSLELLTAVLICVNEVGVTPHSDIAGVRRQTLAEELDAPKDLGSGGLWLEVKVHKDDLRPIKELDPKSQHLAGDLKDSLQNFGSAQDVGPENDHDAAGGGPQK